LIFKRNHFYLLHIRKTLLAIQVVSNAYSEKKHQQDE